MSHHPSIHTSRAVLAAAGALALLAAPAGAQDVPRQFSVTVNGGGIAFDRSASLGNSPFLGIDGEYAFSRNFGIGTSVQVSQPRTRGEDFITTITFGLPASGDTTLFFENEQPTNLASGTVFLTGKLPLGRFTPFVMGGGGYYGMFLDPQSNSGQRRFSGFTASAGAGVHIAVSGSTGFVVEARNQTLMNYKRTRLAPDRGVSPNTVFPYRFGTPPENKDNVNNLLFSLGFRYVPGNSSREGSQ